MKFSEYLSKEWVPALGCTEPASIALAAATAANHLDGPIDRIELTVDARIYKNCYAVGIPNSGHKTGILWAVSIGTHLPNAELGLECFQLVNEEIIDASQKLIDANKISVSVNTKDPNLLIDCKIFSGEKSGRTVIKNYHTNIVLIERNGIIEKDVDAGEIKPKDNIREVIANLSIGEMIDFARSIEPGDRERLREGIAMNRKIAEHGLTLFPRDFVRMTTEDNTARASALVCGGVYARMWGEEMTVMSLSASGNKGITASVPMSVRGETCLIPQETVDEALALACLVTSATTHHLGTLSAVCGCSNAAGIGLAAGLVLMNGGAIKEIELAINNMVGNVTGMICDGAKIGCALKTMTAVDAAFRASSLAMSGMGIPVSDGIIGSDGAMSLKNMGRIATLGMVSTDSEILKIMNEKLGTKTDE
jgi:L-cysteine desulfidase